VSGPRVFDEVTRTKGAGSWARRAAYLAGSTVVQVVATLALAALFTTTVSDTPREARQVVEVKFVKGAPRPATPPPAPPPRRAVPPRAPPVPPSPAAPMIQPRYVPEQLPPPGPAESAVEAPAEGTGVIGGAPGGLAGAPTQAAERTEFDAASMTRPVFVSGPDPTYTRAALSHDVEGLMVVACVVTREGLVRECRVLQGLPHMDAAVVQALERRRYRPATLNGVPIEVTYQFRLNLRLPR
jgi:TonB family protein